MSICSACEHNSVYHWNDSGCQFQDCDCRLNRSDPEFSARHDERGNVMSRPEPVATADLVAEWRKAKRARAGAVGSRWESEVTRALPLGDALAKALEDTAAERDRAHATLRGLVPLLREASEMADDVGAQVLASDLARACNSARERLANP